MKRPPHRLLWASVFLIVSPLEAATPSPSLGINIGGVHRWTLEEPFIDEMKRAEVLTQSNSAWNTGELDKVDWDENGWPRSLSGHQFDRVSYLLFGGDYSGWDSPRPKAGKFKVHYEGKGTLTYRFGASKTGSCGTHCDEITIDLSSQSLALVSITETDSNDHLRNIQVIHDGGLCDSNPTQHHESAATCTGTFQSYSDLRHSVTYHADYLAGLDPFGTIRFMDFQATNAMPSASDDAARINLPRLSWDQRSRPEDAQWNHSYIGGAPLEPMIELVNVLNARPWFDMPTLATDDYVQGFAQLTLEQLDSDQTVYVEYGNEIWNTAFPAGEWVAAMAKQQWPGTDRTQAKLNWFAKRTNEMCKIWKDTWGSESHRVQCVMAGHGANSWSVEAQVMACPMWRDDNRNPNKGTDCGSQVDAVAIAPYFGGYVGQAGNLSKLEELATRGEAGLDALFVELSAGGVLPVSHEGGALARSQQWVNATIAVANKWNKPVLGYEGGQHLVGISGVQNSTKVTELFRQANRDPRMGELYLDYLQGWKDAGASTMVLYNNVSAYAKWGSWGLRESMYDESPKYLAAKAFAAGNPSSDSDTTIAETPPEVINTPAPVSEDEDQNVAAIDHGESLTLTPSAGISVREREVGTHLLMSFWDHAFLKFNLTSVSEAPLKAELVLRHADNYRGSTRVWPAAHDDWSGPAQAPESLGFEWLDNVPIDDQAPIIDGVTLDVTQHVLSELSGDKTVAFEIGNESPHWQQYDAANSALVLTFASATVPETPTPETPTDPQINTPVDPGHNPGNDSGTDSGSNPSTDSGTDVVTPPVTANINPVASYSWNAGSDEDPFLFNFDASGSNDSDGFISSYTWSVNNQMFDGQQLQYRFANEGTFTVSLTVVDNLGGAHVFSQDLVIRAPAEEGDATSMVLMPSRDVGGSKNFTERDLPISFWDRAFISFDLNALDGVSIDDAGLRIYKQEPLEVVTAVFHDPDFVWNNTASAPPRDAIAGKNLKLDEANMSSTGWFTLDVSEALKQAKERGQSELTLELKTNHGSWVRFGASEGGNSPRLEVNGTASSSASETSTQETATAPETAPADDMTDMPNEMDMSHHMDDSVTLPAEMPSMMMGNFWGNDIHNGPTLDSLTRLAGSNSYDILRTGEMPINGGNAGAFRNVCSLSHYNYDDPIVKPGETSTTHLHMFFGNTLTDGSSTYDSLRNNGGSTCRGGLANRTAYWAPAMMDASGNVVDPEIIHVYYKSGYHGVSSSNVNVVPDGLRMVAGNAMSMTAQSFQVANYHCSSWSRNSGIPDCSNKLSMTIEFPECWDGKNLDSPDHKSHMAYANNGCPASHPVALPKITYRIEYPTGGSSAGWRLSSDMYEGDQMGYSAHADWFEAWDPEIKKTWTQQCLKNNKDCHSHLVGDGRIMR